VLRESLRQLVSVLTVKCWVKTPVRAGTLVTPFGAKTDRVLPLKVFWLLP
jgi:hypothetical protein